MTSGITLTAIKPAKFQGKYFYQEMIKTAEDTAEAVEKRFKKTTAKWKKKPKWKIEIRPRSMTSATAGTNKISFSVTTDNKIYGYIDKGTKAHIIVPRNAKVLKFKGKSYSGKGRPKKSDYVYTDHVKHPGIKARGYSERVYKFWKDKYPARQRKAMARAAKLSGHNIK